MKSILTLLMLSFVGNSVSLAKPIEEMPALKRVGHLTQVADGKWIDLKHARKVVGSIAICNTSFALTPDGIAKAVDFISTQTAYRDRSKSFGMFRVIAEVRIDDVCLKPYNAIAYNHVEPQDQESIDTITAGLHKASEWFAQILREIAPE